MANHEALSDDVADASLKPKAKGISAVWVIPIIAALVGGWLVFKNITQEKIVVEVAFKSAAGLEAGKTAVKLRNIKVGNVKDVKFSPDLTEVIVVIEFKGVKAEKITDQTRFWVVKPRVGAGGISGLETLLSGAYIEIDPGIGGVPTTRFTGIEQPQIHQLEEGTKYKLTTDKLGSLTIGAPVKYRDITVGMVAQFELVEDHSHVEVEIFVSAPHDKYVKSSTRFWDISGLSIDVGAEGVEFNLDSVSSLLSGGVAFFTENDSEMTQAPENTVFRLHDTEKELIEESIVYSVPMKLYFENGVSGLSKGAPVEFKGMRMGTVTDIGVELNKQQNNLDTFALIGIEPDRLPADQTLSFRNNEERTRNVYQITEKMVNNGMRAQLKTGNILTGQSLIALDFFPADEPKKITYVDGLAIFPTVPETLAGIVDQIASIIQKLESVPVDDISTNIEATTAGINKLIKSFDADQDGMMGLEMRKALEELIRASRSIRSTSEYLERHPEALLKGKQSE